MKKFISILILLLLLPGCEEMASDPDAPNLYSRAYKKAEMLANFQVIAFDSLENFTELRKVIEKLTCEGKGAGIMFSLQEKEYHLTGSASCPSWTGTACYFRRNFIYIKNDSIVTDRAAGKRVPVEALKQVLDELISEPTSYQYDKPLLKPALIFLYIEEEQELAITKKVLKQITEDFAALNSGTQPDFFKYHILFEDFDRSSFLPPPPPPPGD